MTKLGDYFKTKSVNKAEISRKTGISKNRLSELSTKESAKIRGEEIYLIGLAIDVSPSEILEVTCGDLKLKQ
tara:strand:- start:3300 stop:3515 length:216 start_codon:yes stop_codon:yes gene_type:complete